VSRPVIARWMTLAALGALLAATAATPSPAQGKSVDWRLGYDQEFDGKLNVFKSQLTSSYFVFTYVYDTFPYNWRLSDAGPDTRYSLVTAHEVSKDGLVYTFHLRTGVKWSDGKPFGADDVVFTYNAYHDAKENVLAGYVSNMKSIVKIDDATVRYTLTQPDARVLSAYTPVLPAHVWSKADPKKIANFDPCCPMVGTGPYTIDKLDPKGTTILRPNPYFWGPKPKVQRILMIKYGEKEGQLRDIKLNQLDAIMFGDAKWLTDVRKDPNLKSWAIPTPGFKSIAFNMCPPGGGGPKNTCTGPAPGVHWQVVQDKAIRQALAWSIDRDDLVRTVFSGQAASGNGLISPFYKRYFEDYSSDPQVGYSFQPVKARQILKDGGWACPTGGICTKDGRKAQFEMLVRTEFKVDQNAARRIQAWARDVGIQIDISIITSDALIGRNYETSPTDENKYQPNYDAFLWGWGGDLPSPDFNLEVTQCGSYWSDTFYCNPTYDPLPTQALQSLDFKRRVGLMHQAERIILADVPYIILAHDKDIQVTRTDTWTGYHASPEPDGYPFSTSWLQMSLLQPGKGPTTNYAGAPIAILLLLGGAVVVFGVSVWRRHREESGPLERMDAAPERELAGVGGRSAR
jgi:peptide/nickel transport system substrate-binding protein